MSRLFRIASLAWLLGLVPNFAAAQLSPQDELKNLVVPAGMEIGIYASEPMITNPAAIDVDTQGRVWVAEIQFYRGAAKKPGSDQIKVLEDTDGDGRADKSTVFCEGVFAPMSICVAGTKVYVATSPDLWVYEDKNGDLKADGPPTKLLTGFGGNNHDHGAHSLVLGPDHKWWMAHGDTGFDVTGVDGSHIKFPKGAMIRGELDGTKLENVAANFRNPYEIAVSSFGESFCSDNDNDGNRSVRICWILEGGDYGWFGRPGPKFPAGTTYGDAWHFRGSIPGFVPGTLVTGFGSPCGMCYYEGDAFADLKNVPLHCDAGPREVRAYPHEKSGAGFKATSRNFVTSKDDPYFRPDDICTMPDGSLLVADWYDGGVGGHAYNNPLQGRIFRLTPKDAKLQRVGKPGPFASTADAIEGLQNPNLATQFLAREKLLADGEASITALIELTKGAKDPNIPARAYWLLDRIGGSARSEVVEQLASGDPATQALAIRILRRHTTDAEIRSRLLAMCTTELPLSETWRELMLFLAKQTGPDVVDAIGKLGGRCRADDRYSLEAFGIAARGREKEVQLALSKNVKFGPELVDILPLVKTEPEQLLAAYAKILTTVDETQKAALVDRIGLLVHEGALKQMAAIAADGKNSLDIRRRALEWLQFNCTPTGLWSGLFGNADAAVSAWVDYKPSAGFDAKTPLVEAARASLSVPELQVAGLTLIEKAGLKELGPELTALIDSTSTPAEVRKQAITTAVAARIDGAAQTFGKLLKSNDADVRKLAIGALVDLQQWDAVRPAITDPNTATHVVEQMMNSTGGALVLLKWVDAKQLADDVQKLAVARAIKHPDVNVRVLFDKYIPADQKPQRLGSTIKAADILKLTGDPQRGLAIFNQGGAATCKNCHIVRGFGKDMGPDLSQIGKKYEKAALLETILEPSKAISHGYETYLAESDDGQIYAGFLVQQNDKNFVLRTADNKQVRLDAKKIESLTKSPQSIMPELVLRDVTAQDAADLLAYLMSLK